MKLKSGFNRFPCRYAIFFILIAVSIAVVKIVGPAEKFRGLVPEKKKKWKIAYYEGGPFTDYAHCMGAIVQGLMAYGWIEKASLPELKEEMGTPYWDWLASEAKSRYLSFSRQDAYSAGWLEDHRDAFKKNVLDRLNRGDIDLVIAMGTWAGQDLANTRHHVPTVVVSTVDPIASNIIKSVEDSGFDHVTARVDTSRYIRQIRMFHRIVGFKRLGVVYEDTPDGRLYGAVNDLTKVAVERGFDIIPCTYDDAQKDRAAARKACMHCIEQVTGRADAFYLNAMLAIHENINEVAGILKEKGIPSFSMNGSAQVEKGILLSVSTDEGHRSQGLYDARKMIDILMGTRPRDLDQENPDPLDLAINMDTARTIGFNVPAGILRTAKKIYGNTAR